MHYKPMKHQAVSLKHDERNPLVFDTSDPGTGKTFVRLVAFSKRRSKGGGKALVLAPRSLLKNVWAADCAKFTPHLSTSVANAINREAAFRVPADIYITNLDAVTWLARQPKSFFAKFDELIVDESEAYKHHTSARSKSVAKIAKYFKQRKLLTGTPNTRSITDVWHQVFVLDGGQRLGNSFYRFRDTVCNPVQQGRGANMVKWVDKEGAEEAVFGLLSDVVIRHRFEDCVDIPPTHIYTLDYELPPKQMKAYAELEATAMLQLKSGSLNAVNAAALATKLLQVASGAVYSSADVYHQVDTGRYEMALDLIEARKGTLCFFNWKHQRDNLVAEAIKRKVRYCVFDGNTSDKEREELVKHFQMGLYQVMFAHPASAGHGLTLTTGDTTLWVSPTYNLSHYAQGSKRIPRMGQTKKTENIMILAKDTMELKVYDMLTEKDGRMKNLLDLFGTLNQPAKKPVAVANSQMVAPKKVGAAA
jgi:SNF2 family DNA or RNA helicase